MSNLFYGKSTIDRADHLRKDAAAVAALRHAPSTRIVPVCGGKSLTTADSSPPLALFLQTPPLEAAQEVFLGTDEHRAYFAADLSDLDESLCNELIADALDLQDRRQPGMFRDLRSVGPVLTHHEGSLLAYARGLIYWNSITRHCIRCGNPLVSINAGHVRRCTGCEHTDFPRTDPAVIMLVTHRSADQQELCLLGRSPGWPEGVFSTLAGFVEPGESLEMAVRREVLEEASIQTDAVHYVTSQPWPFPRSIMLGFEATAISTEIRCDPAELADAQWFTRAQLRSFGNWGDDGEGYKLPRTDSIARHLIDRWIGQAER